MDYLYKAEYAKSSRSSCRNCKDTIEQGKLRLAVMVQSSMFDGKVPQWYHSKCFFKKQRPKTEGDIENYQSLRIEDQEKVKKWISNSKSIIVSEINEKKGKKRPSSLNNLGLNDFKIELAKSNRSTCRGCNLKIMKNEVRISKKNFDTEIGMKYGGQDYWYHSQCFAKLRATSDIGYFDTGEILPGFKLLSKDEQSEIKSLLPAIKQEFPQVKKSKIDESNDADNLFKKQLKIMYKYRDFLYDNLNKNDLVSLLDANNQEVPVGKDKICDRLADIMTFGTLLPCTKCSGQFVFNSSGYVCEGNVTEWSKCTNIVQEPKRKPFFIPDELKDTYPYLKKYKYVPRIRIIKFFDKTTENKIKDEIDNDNSPKIKRDLPALYEMEFLIFRKSIDVKDEIKKNVAKFGGKITTKLHDNVVGVFATNEDIKKMNKRMIEIRDKKIHVLSNDFFNKLDDKKFEDVPELIKENSICNWGLDDINSKILQTASSKINTKSIDKEKKSIYERSVPSKLKMIVKNGSVIDPETGLEKHAHIYENNGIKYTCVLGLTDIQKNKNSFYKLQLLKADKSNKFWVFRSWGRIGTVIGNSKLEKFSLLKEALNVFHEQYEDKTGNDWLESRNNFIKIPNKYYEIDIDYTTNNENDDKNLNIINSKSKLPKEVQNLIKIIFDVHLMKKVMMEFEIDAEKMPLGKLTKKQIQNAYCILNELQQLLNSPEENVNFFDVSNKFYTLIPHSFGINNPPLLNNQNIIKQKLEMLDILMELEIAYNLMKSTKSENSIDNYYNKLNTTIELLETDNDEYKIIEEYVNNTHAETHNNYKLKILDIFKINRKGEDKRFKPFKKLHNHKLLWHGSRITNFAGILSQGLRSAPPEAPVTGYMFGKGIYFADMVSKSANYCCTSIENSNGLLLLCDVALGNMYEKLQAEHIVKLPKGKHSTKGIGRTEPDPSASKFLDTIEVPVGKGIINNNVNSALLYNEYVVYDIAQVNIKYLLKLDFQYNY